MLPNNMQPTLFPTTFLSKTAHAAQLPNAAISNDFSIKNSSCSPTAQCSYFQRLFYQKQLMQPNCPMQLFPTTFLSKTAHAAQLPNAAISSPTICSPNQKQLMQQSPPSGCAAISNDFSIKNSSCSPTAQCSYFQPNNMQPKSKTAHATIPTLGVCSYFQRLFYQKQPNKNPHPRGVQLFPTTFLSKTAQQKSPPSGCAAISNDFSIKNSSCSPERKKMEKKSPSNSRNQHPIPTTTHPTHHHLTTTTITSPPPPTYLPHLTTTTTSYQAPTHTHPAPTHFPSSLSYAHKYSSTHNQAISTALPGCSTTFYQRSEEREETATLQRPSTREVRNVKEEATVLRPFPRK
jgi:hypothetical protein